MNFIAKTAAIAALMLSAVLPAQADVIFNFDQTGPTRGTEFGNGNPTVVDVRFDGRLIVPDAAYAAVFNYSASSRDFPLQGGTLDQLKGLPDFEFTISNSNKTRVLNNNYLFGFPNAAVDVVSSYNFSSTPSGTLVGGLTVSGGGDTFILSFLADKTFTVLLGSDYRLDFGGCIQFNCTAQGQVVADRTRPVPVPEPASLALFGMGLVGMGLIRRKRAA